MSSKVLVIRFSSFGDVLQTLSVVGKIGRNWPGAKVHWVTRSEFLPLIEKHPELEKVWVLNRKDGFTGLIRLGLELRKQNFTHLYDSHNNLRSHVLSWILRFGRFDLKFLRRSIRRWKRFLLFRFRINQFRMPFSGQRDLLEPLKEWGLSDEAPPTPQIFIPETVFENLKKRESFLQNTYVTLAPSAAFPLKRWPLEYWLRLIEQFPQENFVVLGGPEDTFLKAFEQKGSRILNLSGKLSLAESASVIMHGKALISNDTGLMHVAEQSGANAIALMGPAPFGFPSRPKTKILELNLPCRPCSKHGQGPCVNPEFQKCLRDISVTQVSSILKGML